MKNFKEHAIFRYLSRTLGVHIINDRTFKMWKQNEDNKAIYQQALKELVRIESESDFRITEKVQGSDKKVEYAINTKEMSILVIDKNDVLTYYELEYCDDINKNSNLNIFKIFKKEYDGLVNSLEKFDNKNEKKITKAQGKIDLYNSEILALEEKMKELKTKRDIEKNTIQAISIEKEVIKKNINTVVIKLVKPVVTF